MNQSSILFLFSKRVFLVIGILCCIPFFANAQDDDWSIAIDGKVYKGSKKLSGAIVVLYKNGEVDKKYRTNDVGKFTFTLKPDNDYLIEIGKEGFVTKRISFSTENVPPDNVRSGFPAYSISVDLFEDIKGLNTSILDEPIGLIRYYAKGDNFDFDEDYTYAIQDQLKKLLDEIEKKQKEYKDAIEKGDKLFVSKKYTESRQQFEIALDILSFEEYPKKKLEEIKKKLEDEKLRKEQEEKENAERDQAEKLKEIESKYKKALSDGDAAMLAKKYSTAIEHYNLALQVKPAEVYPKEKIKEAEQLIKDEKLFGEAEAQRKEEEARLREIEEKYKKAISSADGAFSSKDYDKSKGFYEQALQIKQNESYPKERIVEIDKLLSDKQARELEAKKNAEEQALLKEIDEKYNKALSEAGKFFSDQEYDLAIEKYKEALSLKSEETYPKQKINEINQLIEEKRLADEEAKRLADEEAKRMADEEARRKAAEEAKNMAKEELEKKYQEAIKNGDNSFETKEYTQAINYYKDAIALQANESYPKNKIKEIESILRDIAKDKQEQKRLEGLYNDAIASGESELNQKNYVKAKEYFQEALKLKPEEKYPAEKIEEIVKAIEDKRLLDEENRRKAELEQIERDKERKYETAIANGDIAFNKANYQSAKSFYVAALGVKSGESYPTNRLELIEQELEEIRQKEEEERRKKQEIDELRKLEERYDNFIKQGDNEYGLRNYQSALQHFEEALKIKSAEEYPINKIAEINKILEEQGKLKEDQEKKQKSYLEAIKTADELFANNSYSESLSKFREALSYKPNESYPKGKITVLEKLLEEERREMEEENRKKLELEAQLKREAEIKEKYEKAISNGDNSLSSSDLKSAKKFYEEALSYYSEEKHPKDQLVKINRLLSEEEKKRLEEEDRINNRDKYYREAIARGNAANELRKYQVAIAEYEAALELKPEEDYAAEKIKEIKTKLELAQKFEDEKATLVEESKKEPEGISMEKERILSELALEYPEGLTEETYMDGQKKIVRRIVVKYGRADDYKMIVQPWGAKFYFKNDKSIPSHLFALETDVD